MPLINCPDCNHEVSDIAPTCPNCGRLISTKNLFQIKAIASPGKGIKKLKTPEDKAISILRMAIAAMGIVLASTAFVVGVGVYLGFVDYRDRKAAKDELKEIREEAKNIQNELQKTSKNIFSRASSVKEEITQIGTNIKKDAELVKGIRQRVEKDAEALRDKYKDVSPSLPVLKITEELKEQLDDFSRRMYLLELLGVELKSKDYLRRASLSLLKGEYELALKNIDKATEINPKNASAWADKSFLLGVLGRYNESLSAAEKAIELDPNNSKAWGNMGVSFDSLGRYKEALSATEKALTLDPKNAKLWVNKSTILDELERRDESLSAINKALELDPDLVGAMGRKANALIIRKRYGEAKELLFKAIKIQPKHPKLWYTLSNIYAIEGDRKNFIESLEKALNLNSSFKKLAKEDSYFGKYKDDPDFKKLIE